MGKIKHPWGPMDTQVLTAAATVAATVDQPSILQVGSAAITANFTLNLTAGASLQAGDQVMVTWQTGTTVRHMITGTGFKGSTTTVTATASSHNTALLQYDGAAFHLVGFMVQ